MNRRIMVVVAALLAAGVGIGAYLYLASDERKIRRRFDELAELVSKGPEESLLLAAQKIQGTARLFAKTCVFKTHVPELTGTLGPEEISGHLSRARQYFGTIALEFTDLRITLVGDSEAEVSVTSRLQASAGAGGVALDEIHELLCILEKTDGTWLFRELEVVSVLER